MQACRVTLLRGLGKPKWFMELAVEEEAFSSGSAQRPTGRREVRDAETGTCQPVVTNSCEGVASVGSKGLLTELYWSVILLSALRGIGRT